MKLAIAVDLGGTKTAVAAVTETGEFATPVQAPTPAREGAETVLDTIAELIRPLLSVDVVGIGVGATGVIDATTGTVVSATDTFHNWVGTNITAGLRERLGFEGPIAVRNDVDAHLEGEAWRGAARDYRDVFMVAVGTGVGSAVMLDGQLRGGVHNFAGEFGHFPALGAEGLRCPCGKLGHLEALSAGPAMLRSYLARGGQAASTQEVMQLAVDGEPLAAEVIGHAAASLGRAIAGVVTVLDPGCVVVGGGVAEAGEIWWRPMEQALRADLVDALRDIPVLPAMLGNRASIVGAAAAVFSQATNS